MAEVIPEKLTSEDFNPSSYVKELTIKCDGVEDLQTTREKIQKLAEETNGLLKKNVYKNYTQFIETSKEISYLESEMYQLSHMLTEQQTVLNSLIDISIAGDKIARPCELDKEVDDDKSKNLASLLENIEGCATVLEVRGRSVIHKGELIELNINDFKPVQRVYCVLLNDGLMFAVKIEKRRGPVQFRFQTLYEHDSLAVVNVQDDSVVKNAFKILMFPDSRLFQCSSPIVKKEWITVIEQAKKKKMSSFKRELSLSDSQNSPFSNGPVETNPFEEEDEDILDNYEREMSLEMPNWLLELPEDLDVCIAQREFEKAVNCIHKANEHFAAFPKSVLVREMKVRIDNRVKQLVEVLKNELKVTPERSLQGGPRSARRAVSVLLKLGRSSVACDLFLKQRTAILKQNLKQQKMEGATVPFVEKLCSSFFSCIIEAGREYNKAFESKNSCSSSFIVWSKTQLQHFIQLFSRHVFTPQVTPSVAAVCISFARNHCNELLSIGLDLSFILNNFLQTYVERLIMEIRDKLLEAIKLRANDDKWRPQNYQSTENLRKFIDEMKEIGIDSLNTYIYDDCWVSLTSNTTAFSKMYLNFMDDLLKLYTPTVHVILNDALVVAFQTQLTHVNNAYQSATDASDKQFILKNATFLVETVLHIAGKHYMEKLGLMFPKISELRYELSKISTPGRVSFTKYSSTAYI